MMARIRTIKPEFWRDENLSNVSAEACLLAIGLLNHCDDEGYFNANPKLVESDVFPLRKLSVTTTVALRELSGIGYIRVFDGTDGKSYGHIVNFLKHQVINKKTPSKIKDLEKLQEDYGSDTVGLPTGKERKGKEVEHIDAYASLSETAFPPCPHQKILSLYSKHLGHLPQPRVWDGNRASMLRQRWLQAAKPSTFSPDGYKTESDGLAWWDSFFAYIANDTKLTKGFENGGRVWQADLPWIVTANNFAKIIDGKYNK